MRKWIPADSADIIVKRRQHSILAWSVSAQRRDPKWKCEKDSSEQIPVLFCWSLSRNAESFKMCLWHSRNSEYARHTYYDAERNRLEIWFHNDNEKKYSSSADVMRIASDVTVNFASKCDTHTHRMAAAEAAGRSSLNTKRIRFFLVLAIRRRIGETWHSALAAMSFIHTSFLY